MISVYSILRDEYWPLNSGNLNYYRCKKNLLNFYSRNFGRKITCGIFPVHIFLNDERKRIAWTREKRGVKRLTA